MLIFGHNYIESTCETWFDNIYYTSDIAWHDEDGYYWFFGRTGDVIKSSGCRIASFEVESALMTSTLGKRDHSFTKMKWKIFAA